MCEITEYVMLVVIVLSIVFALFDLIIWEVKRCKEDVKEPGLQQTIRIVPSSTKIVDNGIYERSDPEPNIQTQVPQFRSDRVSKKGNKRTNRK